MKRSKSVQHIVELSRVELRLLLSKNIAGFPADDRTASVRLTDSGDLYVSWTEKENGDEQA